MKELHEYTLSERDLLAIFKAFATNSALNDDMTRRLLDAAKNLETNEQDEHFAAVHLYNVFEFAEGRIGDPRKEEIRGGLEPDEEFESNEALEADGLDLEP